MKNLNPDRAAMVFMLILAAGVGVALLFYPNRIWLWIVLIWFSLLGMAAGLPAREKM